MFHTKSSHRFVTITLSTESRFELKTFCAAGLWRPSGVTAGFDHRDSLSPLPQGGNEAFVDGSARWIKFQQMLFLTTWDTQNRIYYFFQEDLPPTVQAVIARLRAGP
jgi:hypothetical protein